MADSDEEFELVEIQGESREGFAGAQRNHAGSSSSPDQTEDESLMRLIEASKRHWTETRDKDDDEFDMFEGYTDREVFDLVKDVWKEWLTFSKDVKSPEDLVLGKKLTEGGQAEIFEVKNCQTNETDQGFVWKVFKKGHSIRHLVHQWPDGLLHFKNFDRCLVRGATVLEDDRFAFLMKRADIDLRKLIDIARERNSPLFKGKRNRRPLRSFATYKSKLQHEKCPDECLLGPLFDGNFVLCLMFRIAYDMYMLHDIGVLHRDLKAANILCSDDPMQFYHERCTKCSCRERKSSDGYEDARCIRVYIGDYESSHGTVGTNFWRAPEILQQIKEGKESTAIHFLDKSDVYSFAMLFYEVLTGCIPFEEYKVGDYEHVLRGNRPTLPDYVPLWMRELIEKCWHQIPTERPTFYRIWQELREHACDATILSYMYIRGERCPVVLKEPDPLQFQFPVTTATWMLQWLIRISTVLLCKYFYPKIPIWERLCAFIFLSEGMTLICLHLGRNSWAKSFMRRPKRTLEVRYLEVPIPKKENIKGENIQIPILRNENMKGENTQPVFKAFTGKSYFARETSEEQYEMLATNRIIFEKYDSKYATFEKKMKKKMNIGH